VYKQQRNYENLNKALFPGVGAYGIPALSGGDYAVDNWISFNFARTCDEPNKHGIHFFIDDYQFIRLWTNPDNYIAMLKRFQAVCTPDFSTYTDFPKAIQIYNHFRKHWLGAYWERNGINVIPTISWSDESSFDWCFDGEPVGKTVAVSSVGTQQNATATRLFELGYREMMQRLKPAKVIVYGKVPECCTGNVVRINAFTTKWREKEGL
jgi:gene 1 protein